MKRFCESCGVRLTAKESKMFEIENVRRCPECFAVFEVGLLMEGRSVEWRFEDGTWSKTIEDMDPGEIPEETILPGESFKKKLKEARMRIQEREKMTETGDG